MHINQLRELLNSMESRGLSEIRCLDDHTGTSENVQLQEVMIDREGRIVDEYRRDCMQVEPFDVKVYQGIYEDGDYWKDQYQSFQDFYIFMENARIKEVELIQSARPVMLIGPEYLPMT